MASHKHGLPVLVDDVIVNPGGNNHVKHDPGQDVFEERPVEDGKLAEPPDCDSPDRRCNLTNAAITSTTLLVDDIRIRRCCQRCTRVLQSHLKQLRRERSQNYLEQHAVVFRASVIWSIWSPWKVLHRLMRTCISNYCYLKCYLIGVPVFPNPLNLTVVIRKVSLSRQNTNVLSMKGAPKNRSDFL